MRIVGDHTHDLTKIAPPLQALAWQPIERDLEWCDGTVLLVAVPICGRGTFVYEYHVVTLAIDAHLFDVRCNDEISDVSLDDCDWYVVIHE